MKKTEFIALIRETITKVDGIPSTAATDEVDPEIVSNFVELNQKIDAKLGTTTTTPTPTAGDGTTVDVTNDL